MRIRSLLFAVATAGLTMGASAQITNGGFENWDDQGDFMEPVGWLTLNQLVLFDPSLEAPCERMSPGAIGSYHAKLTSRNSALVGALPSLLSAATVGSDEDGIPYTSRPTALTCMVQYNIQPGDMGLAGAVLTKWNAATGEADTIAMAVEPFVGTQSQWTSLNIPFIYGSNDFPDTAFIIIATSVDVPVAGSTVSVDEVGFDGSVIITEPFADRTRIYPVPATDVVHIETDGLVREVDVFDLTGRLLKQESVTSMPFPVDLSGLATGRYVVRLHFANGERQVHPIMKD